MVLPVGTSVPNLLYCLLTQIMEVVAHGICHGATGALTIGHLRLCHKVDLRRVRPRFSAVEEIPDNVDVGRLNAELSGNAEAIVAIIDMEQIINDSPL